MSRKPKKTVDVDTILKLANRRLRNTADVHKNLRIGICVMIEDVLHEACRYRGYSYLNQMDMQDTKNTPGVSYENGTPVFHDNSRRAYH